MAAKSPLATAISINSSSVGWTFSRKLARSARRSGRSILRSAITSRPNGWKPLWCPPPRPRLPNPCAQRRNMFDPSSSIIVGLEIGTSKVCAVVGELSADNALNIVGLGQSRSRGVRKGEITDPSMAEEDIRQAIVEAEQMADVEI